jgi:hypothetical protein
MTTKAYAKRKAQLLPQLRNRNDPPPRIMRVGALPRQDWCSNLSGLLASTGGSLVRGYKLYKMPLDPDHWDESAWLAIPHAVVQTISTQGTVVYTDPSAHETHDTRRGEPITEYIFVPSSRACRELTAEQWVSGQWILGTVVGGDARFCQAYVIHKRVLGRWSSTVGTSPEEAGIKRHVFVRMMPHFIEWHRERGYCNGAKEQADMMGAAAFPVGVEVDESDLLRTYNAISDNTEAYTDGLLGLKIESKCREKLWLGELTVEEARAVFYAHFDATATIVRCKQRKLLLKRLQDNGFNTVYS